MADYIDCRHPAQHGVKRHVVGSLEAQECLGGGFPGDGLGKNGARLGLGASVPSATTGKNVPGTKGYDRSQPATLTNGSPALDLGFSDAPQPESYPLVAEAVTGIEHQNESRYTVKFADGTEGIVDVEWVNDSFGLAFDEGLDERIDAMPDGGRTQFESYINDYVSAYDRHLGFDDDEFDEDDDRLLDPESDWDADGDTSTKKYRADDDAPSPEVTHTYGGRWTDDRLGLDSPEGGQKR